MRRLAPVAVVFLVLLALVVAKYASRSGPGAVGTPGDVVPLAPEPFEPKDVAKIEVFAPGGTEPVVRVVREGAATAERWIVETPFRAPAHVNRVEDLAKRLAAADAELRSSDASVLSELHLTPDRAVALKVTAKDGRVLSHVAIGRSSQKQGAFVRPLGGDGDPRAWVTTANLRGLLGLGRTAEGAALPEEPKPGHFHDATFPQVELSKASRLEIHAPRRRLAFEKQGPGWTAVEGDPGAPVSVGGVTQVLQSFGSAFQPSGLADPSDLAKLGLAQPTHTLAVTLADGTVRRVFGAMDASGGTGYVRLDAQQEPDVVYEAAIPEWNRLFPTGASLFELKPVTFPDTDLERIVVTKGADRLEIVRDDTKPSDEWRVEAPKWPLVPRQASFRSLAALLHNVRPTDWCDGPDVGEEHAVLRYGKRDAAEDALATLRIGGKTPSGRDRLALLPGDSARAWVLTDSTVDRLAAPLLSAFEPKFLHGWAEPDVTAVRVASRDGEAWKDDFAIERDGEQGWTLVRGAEKTPANAAAAKKWLDTLLGAQVREVGGDGATAVRVVVERKSGTPFEAEFSAETDGKRTGTIGEFRFTCDAKDLVPAAETLLAAPALAKPPDEEE